MENLALLIGFCIMFGSTGAYFAMAMKFPEEKRAFHYITMFVTGIASIAYLIMAFDGGLSMVTLATGQTRKFYFVRYIECARALSHSPRMPAPRASHELTRVAPGPA